MNWIEKAEQCFGGMSVRRKLTLMSFGISVVVSLLSSAAFYFFLVAQLEETITEDVEAVAEMTAQRPGLKVIITSGYSPELVSEGIQLAEGVNYLPKPYSPADLAGILEKAFASAGSPALAGSSD